MNRFCRWVDNLVARESWPFRFDPAYEDIRQEYRRRSVMALFINLFGLVATVTMGTVVWNDGYRLLALVDYATALNLIVSTGLLVLFGKVEGAVIVTMSGSVLLFSMFVFIGGEDNSAVLWLNTYPVIAMFLSGRNRGLIFSSVVLVMTAVMLYTPVAVLLRTRYVTAFKLRIVLTYVLVGYVAYVYESLREAGQAKTRRILDDARIQAGDLERSNAELEAFARIASHQLREPVRKISVTVSRRQRKAGRDGDDADRLCRTIGKNTERLARMLWGLDAYTAVDRGIYSPRTVDLRQVCEKAVGELRDRGLAGNADITCKGLPVAEGEPAKIQALFSHLLRNSIMYTREGVAPVITVRGTVSGNDCVIEVADNGRGIEPGLEAKAFLPFRQLHHAGEGSIGMGLPICRKIIERHHGTIALVPRKEPGTVVRLTLPRCGGFTHKGGNVR